MILASKCSERDLSKTFRASHTVAARNVSVALCSAIVSVLQCMPVAAADPAASASPAGGNKQIAAIETPIKKDETKQAPVSVPTNPVATPNAPAATPLSTPVVGATTDSADSDANADNAQPAPKLLLKPGQPLILGSETEDVQPTDDVNLAKEQALHFPDSAEASFILAVALTRTSRVEEALTEVRHARKLAQTQGGPAYFDKMIKSYEEMLESVDDPRVRYSLAWAYYMKAYLLAQDSRRVAPVMPQAVVATSATPVPAVAIPITAPNAVPGSASSLPAPANLSVPNTMSAKAEKKKVDQNMAIGVLSALNPDIAAKMAANGGKVPASQLPTIPTAIQKAAPAAVPQIHQYYADALRNLDAVLAKKPDDVWALLYRWHLYAEDTGNLSEAMKQWKEAERRFPSNPGVQFFLGEGYLKEGNLKEAVIHASKAVLLRGLGN